jgi:transglutaminase-like putative cysteine protease
MKYKPAHLWDFASAGLLILILLIASQRLYITHWATNLGVPTLFAIIGVVLGLVIGLLRFNPMIPIWLAPNYSIPIINLVMGVLLSIELPWLNRLLAFNNRLASAFGLFMKNQPVRDTILFVVFMTVLFWVIGLIAGYALTRSGNFIAAVVPAGVVLVVIQLYDPGNSSNDGFLAAYFIFSLLFLGRLTYFKRRLSWEKQRVSTLAESRADLNITFAAVALATVLLVWLAPTSLKSFSDIKTAWQNLTRPVRDVQENLGHAVAGLQGSSRAVAIQFFGDELSLGNQAATGENAYLSIKTPLAGSTSRYYWRVRSYNTYLNNQWYAENVSSKVFSPGQTLISLADAEGVPGNFEFTALSANLATLVTPARPVWVSYPSKLYFVQLPQGKMDPIQFLPNPPLLAGKQYSVSANEYEPTILQLRSAGEDYPDWVLAQYMQLPGTLSPEIVALAQRITANASTPYDKADAVTNYLRTHITYSTTVGKPPAGQDPLAWFLLDSKRGFCNYYATAEVIMLRAVGIPARMTVGFAQGEFKSPDTYVVRQRDLHAWPEVYFPGVGWVEFEPTTNQAPLVRPLDANPSASAPDEESHAEIAHEHQMDLQPPVPIGGSATVSNWVKLADWLMRLAILYAFSVTILWLYSSGFFDKILQADQQTTRKKLPVLLKNFIEKRGLRAPAWLRRWAYMAELNSVERCFKTVFRSLRWLGVKAHPAQTPAEAADALAGRLPVVSKEINDLLFEYQRQFYSQKHGYLPLAYRAMRAIRQETWRAVLQQRWMAFRGVLRLSHP